MSENFKILIVLFVFIGGGIAFNYFTLVQKDIQSAFWVWVLIIGTLFWAARSHYSKTSGRSAVLWLRRFHAVEPYRYPMLETLKAAGASRFHVVTIQDTKFRYSYLTGAMRSGCLLIFLFFFITLPLVLIVFFVSLQLLGFESEDFTGIGGILKLLAVLLIYCPVCALIILPSQWTIAKLIARFRGVERLHRFNLSRRIRIWSKKVRKGRYGPSTTLKIFKCADDFWKDTVAKLLLNCDAVVIDVSDMNESIAWEVSKCAEEVGIEKLIFLFSTPPDHFPSEYVRESIIVSLDGLIGNELLKAQFIEYPESLPDHHGSTEPSPGEISRISENLHSAFEKALVAGKDGPALTL